jgi:hypothetical protein
MEEEKVIDVFEKLKEMLSNVSILTTPKHVDASNIIVGTTFSQLDEKGHDHPIYYASQQLIMVEQNYAIAKRKALVIIFVVKKFHHYLLGNKFTIVIDYQAFKYLLSNPNPIGRIA